MKEYIEAHKIDSKDNDHPIKMEWLEPVDQKKDDTAKLEKPDKEDKIKKFKEKHGTGYKYFKHICRHDEGQPCDLEEV